MDWGTIKNIVELIIIMGGFLVGYIRLTDKVATIEMTFKEFKADTKADISEIKEDVKELIKKRN